MRLPAHFQKVQIAFKAKKVPIDEDRGYRGTQRANRLAAGLGGYVSGFKFDEGVIDFVLPLRVLGRRFGGCH